MKNNLILTMKAEKELSAIGGEQTLFKQPTNHPLITHLSPTCGSHLDAIRKYAAMVVLMLFIGVGNAWATTVYFVNWSDWEGDIYCHNWEGGTGTTWPGTKMNNTDHQCSGHTIYSCEINSGNTKCIFNNNSSQTSNLTISAGKMYKNGSWVTYEWDPEFKEGQYIYINYSTSTWGSASAKFKYNWYYNTSTYCCVDQETGRVSGENYAYAVTPNSYVRAVQILRFNSGYSSQWNYTGTVAVSSQTKNCITLTADVSNDYAFSWTTYAPPMSSVTLSDNETSIVSGSGTNGDPYLVYVGATIKVSASGTKAVADPDATIYYNFKQSSTSKQNGTGTTYQFTASATANTTYTINLDGYTKVSSTSSTKKAATALYYKTIEIPASSHDITYTTQSTGWTYGTKPASAGESDVVTFVVNPTAGYTVSVTSSDVALSGPNASNQYTFTMPDNDVAITVSATENKRDVTISAGTGGSVDKTNASVGVATTTTVTATALPGYRFTGWTATNCSVASSSSASTTLSGDGTTGNATLVANFARTYAFIEGRFHITNSSRNGTWTNTFNSGDWSASSTNIPFEYDGTNHWFYLHTYATPKELTTQISDLDPFFYINTSTESGSLTNPTSYWSASSTTITTAGNGGKKTLTHTGSLQNANLRFNSSDNSGYTILYFDEAGVWYELEQTLKYNGNGSTGGSAPAGTVYYNKGVNAKAASNSYTKTGHTFTGWRTGASSGTAYAEGADVPMNSNITLYAQWQINTHAVTYTAPSHGSYTIKVGTADAVSANTTSDYGKQITLAANPATGYHFVSWSVTKTADASTVTVTNNLFTMPDYPVTVSATFAANTYSVTFDSNDGEGDAMSAQAFTYDVAQALSANTYTRTGYDFDGWATAADGAKVYNNEQSVSNLTATNGGTFPLFAHWAAKSYTVTLDIDEANHGTIDGKATSASVTFDASPTAIAADQLPTAAQGYAFMGFFTAAGGEGVQVINANGTWIASVTGYTDASGNWILADVATLYAYYKKAEITALTLDNAVVAPSGEVGVTPTVAPTPTGTNSICWKLLYSNGNLYSPQPTFSPASPAGISNKVTFTAPSTSGTYLVAAVLRTGNDCNGGTKLDSVVSSFQVAGDHNVTVQYKCGDDVIRASASVTGKPLASTEITAPDIVGYTFSKWKAGDGITIEGADDNGEKASATINFTAIYDGKLTAIYTKKQMIYFNNTLKWTDVWVYFYNDANGNKYWANNYGTGANKQQYFSGNAPYYEQEHGHMTQIEGTDIWYFDFKAAGYNTTRTKVAFVNKNQSIDKSSATNDEAYFHNASVIYREDFDATNLPMFVPINAVEYDYTANTGSKYYRGYWMNYPESTGYTLKIYNKKANDGSDPEEIRSIPFEFTADKTMPMELDVDLEAGKTYGFKVYCNNDTWLGNNGTMTATTPNWDLSINTSNCGLTTTAAGNYKFTLNYFAVGSTDYKLRIGVTYPVATGDYQVLYKDDTMSKWFISSVVPAASDKDTVSFFVRKDKHPVLKLRKCTSVGTGTVTWSDTVANLISVLPSAITQDSVYIFCLNKNAEGKRALGDVKAYTGNYYIRTDCAGTTKWDNYRAADHLMTYSEYSEKNSDFTHYFVQHVNSNTNVKYVIANDYSPNISDTLAQQDGDVSTTPAYTHVNTDGFLQANANIRFMWNRHDNNVVRAYLADAQTDGLEFLVLRANSNTDMTDENGDALLNSANSGQAGYNHKAPDNSIQFTDKENWIYEANIKIKPGAFAKLYAKFDNGYFYFKGVDNNTFDASNAIQLMEGTGDLQKVRVVFDFKTDRLLAAWVPEDATIGIDHKINADVMFVREGQGDIAQLTFESDGKISAIKSAYGVMRFNKYTLNNKSKEVGHAVLDDPKSVYERSLYFISFPFRVKLNDVFGFGTYGTHWAIQKYNGARRAAEGFWAESSGFWEWMDRTDSLMPNQGYLLAIDLDLLGEDNTAVWGPDNRSEQIELYFPSYGTMPDITNANVKHTLPSHACTINWSGRSNGNGGTLGSAYNRTVIDSHWNVMSVPTYVNTSNVSFANEDWITAADGKHGPNFLYTWNMDDNTLTPTAGKGYHYHAMHAYMVQYHGDVTWKASSGSPYSSIVARRTYAEKPKETSFCMEIQQEGKMIDRTYVVLSNDEETKTEFSFGEDMGKEFNVRNANVYTIVEGYIPTAGNTLPQSEQTTVVPVGIKVNKTGEYTFAMPEGTNGTGVVLVDTENGTRTNLALGDYTVTLGAGTTDGRFVLEISPVANTPTGIDEVPSDQVPSTNVRKVMVDGVLYIVKDGKAYDARGTRVK